MADNAVLLYGEINYGGNQAVRYRLKLTLQSNFSKFLTCTVDVKVLEMPWFSNLFYKLDVRKTSTDDIRQFIRKAFCVSQNVLNLLFSLRNPLKALHALISGYSFSYVIHRITVLQISSNLQHCFCLLVSISSSTSWWISTNFSAKRWWA